MTCAQCGKIYKKYKCLCPECEKAWVDRSAAVTLGRLGGKARSPAKTAAARRNALLGGRPRKEKSDA